MLVYSMQNLKRSISVHGADMLAQLEQLVAIDSGSYDPDGVNAVGSALQPAWESQGFETERLPLSGFGDRLVFSRRFSGRGTLLILSHLDTVWPKGTAADWPFRIEDGLAHGPGVGDMKGGLVMAHAAVRALIEAGFEE